MTLSRITLNRMALSRMILSRNSLSKITLSKLTHIIIELGTLTLSITTSCRVTLGKTMRNDTPVITI
jgi:hypothetical protein